MKGKQKWLMKLTPIGVKEPNKGARICITNRDKALKKLNQKILGIKLDIKLYKKKEKMKK